MATTTYRFHSGRLVRNFVSLVPLAAFPLVLHLTGHSDSGFFILFGILAAGFVTGVVYTALRFKLSVDAEGLVCRGRVSNRRVKFVDVLSAKIRRGRDKPAGFMGPPPFRELVIETEAKSPVISSLPLGEEAFNDLLEILATHLPESVLASSGDAV